jgi:hypothetical protein
MINQFQNLIHSYKEKCKHITRLKNEFLAVEDISNINDGKLRYEMFVKAYSETREHGGINGLTPSKMFLQRLIKSDTYTKKKQESVTHVGKQYCYLSV